MVLHMPVELGGEILLMLTTSKYIKERGPMFTASLYVSVQLALSYYAIP